MHGNPRKQLNRSRVETALETPEKPPDYSLRSIRTNLKLVFSFCTGMKESLARGRQACEPHGEGCTSSLSFLSERSFAMEARASLGLPPSVSDRVSLSLALRYSCASSVVVLLVRFLSSRRVLFPRRSFPNEGSLVERFLIRRTVTYPMSRSSSYDPVAVAIPRAA